MLFSVDSSPLYNKEEKGTGQWPIPLFRGVLAAALEASALGLSAAVRVTSRNTDVFRGTLFGVIEPAANRLTHNLRISGRLARSVSPAAAASVLVACAACLGRSLCLHSLHADVVSSAAVVLIVRAVYHITIQYCHVTYLLFIPFLTASVMFICIAFHL